VAVVVAVAALPLAFSQPAGATEPSSPDDASWTRSSEPSHEMPRNPDPPGLPVLPSASVSASSMREANGAAPSTPGDDSSPPASNPGNLSPEAPTGETQTEHRYRRVPLAVGGLVLATSFIVKIFGGLLVVASSVDGGCRSCAWHEAGLLLVPIAGPLLLERADRPHSAQGWEITATWSALEAAAVTLVIVGLVGHDVPIKSDRRRPSVIVVPTVTRELGALSLHLSW